ncbi:hypothetical protein PFISCL1PPCAC_6365, partial [Pristionchus fissidentatus]
LMIICIVVISLISIVVGAPPIREEDKTHLEGLPIQRNGELNEHFRQEILLGGEEMDEEEKKKAIDKMLTECDKNGDGRLNVDELEMRIREKKKEHMDESIKEAKELEEKLDTNKDGKISWEEYSIWFIKKEGMEVNKASGTVIGKDNAHKFEDEQTSFRRSDEDGDGLLEDREFRVLLHPENSKRMMNDLARDVLKSMDTNNDGAVSEYEFVHGIPGEIDESMKEFEEKERKERKREFVEDIDRNKDAKADLIEFLSYVDQTNGDNAKREALQILSDADENDDGFISRDELFSKHFLLKDSAIFSARGSMHYDL